MTEEVPFRLECSTLQTQNISEAGKMLGAKMIGVLIRICLLGVLEVQTVMLSQEYEAESVNFGGDCYP